MSSGSDEQGTEEESGFFQKKISFKVVNDYIFAKKLIKIFTKDV